MLAPRENTPSMLFAAWTDMDGMDRRRPGPSMSSGAWTGKFVKVQPSLVGPSGLSGVLNKGKQSGLESTRSGS